MKLSTGLKIAIAAYVAVFLFFLFSFKLFAIILLSAGGAAAFLYVAYLASKSGSQKTINPSGKVEYGPNMPIYTIPQFWFGAILTVATIIFAWIMISDK